MDWPALPTDMHGEIYARLALSARILLGMTCLREHQRGGVGAAILAKALASEGCVPLLACAAGGNPHDLYYFAARAQQWPVLYWMLAEAPEKRRPPLSTMLGMVLRMREVSILTAPRADLGFRVLGYYNCADTGLYEVARAHFNTLRYGNGPVPWPTQTRKSRPCLPWEDQTASGWVDMLLDVEKWHDSAYDFMTTEICLGAMAHDHVPLVAHMLDEGMLNARMDTMAGMWVDEHASIINKDI